MENNQHQTLDTTMVEFQNLPSPPQLNEDLINQLDSNIKGRHWSASFQCVSMIRSIFKFYPEHINSLMERYNVVLVQFLTNGSTQLVKNIMKMMKEMFSHGANQALEGMVQIFLPILIKKAANETTGQIKGISQQVLTTIATCCFYGKTFQISAEYSCDKTGNIAETAIKLLAALIQAVGSQLTQMNPTSLQYIMKGMSFLVNGKKNNMKNLALDICIYICTQIGSENYMQLMGFALNQNQTMLMGQAMETHRTQKNKVVPLAEMLKNRKMQQQQTVQNNNQMGNWNQQQNFR